MNRPRFRLSHVCSCVLVMAVVSVHAACGGDEDKAAPAAQTQDDAGQSPAVPSTDAGDPGEEEGEEITEGGDIPEIVPDDSGVEEVGPDGGIIIPNGCLVVSPGPYSASTCSSRLTTFSSVGLVSGTYQLKSVRVLGSKTFCTDTFKALEHAGALVVDAASAASGTITFYDRFRDPAKPKLIAVNRYAVSATVTGTDVTLGAPTCAAGSAAPATAKFGSGTTEGKKYVLLRLPYGASGEAIYRFEEP